MYQEYVLIVTHLGANFSNLLDSLNFHHDIYCHRQPLQYAHPTDLKILKSLCGSQRICVDTVLFNQHLTHRQCFKTCRFVYQLGHPALTMQSLQRKYGYKEEEALSYYRFRLQRLAFLAQYTKDAVLLTWKQEPIEQAQILNNFLPILSPIRRIVTTSNLTIEPSQLSMKAEKVYNKYYSKIKEAITRHRHPTVK